MNITTSVIGLATAAASSMSGRSRPSLKTPKLEHPRDIDSLRGATVATISDSRRTSRSHPEGATDRCMGTGLLRRPCPDALTAIGLQNHGRNSLSHALRLGRTTAYSKQAPGCIWGAKVSFLWVNQGYLAPIILGPCPE